MGAPSIWQKKSGNNLERLSEQILKFRRRRHGWKSQTLANKEDFPSRIQSISSIGLLPLRLEPFFLLEGPFHGPSTDCHSLSVHFVKEVISKLSCVRDNVPTAWEFSRRQGLKSRLSESFKYLHLELCHIEDEQSPTAQTRQDSPALSVRHVSGRCCTRTTKLAQA